jgi:hypothetical protein
MERILSQRWKGEMDQRLLTGGVYTKERKEECI